MINGVLKHRLEWLQQTKLCLSLRPFGIMLGHETTPNWLRLIFLFAVFMLIASHALSERERFASNLESDESADDSCKILILFAIAADPISKPHLAPLMNRRICKLNGMKKLEIRFANFCFNFRFQFAFRCCLFRFSLFISGMSASSFDWNEFCAIYLSGILNAGNGKYKTLNLFHNLLNLCYQLHIVLHHALKTSSSVECKWLQRERESG